MENNLLNRGTDILDNCVSPVQNRVFAEFCSLPVLIRIIWICRNKGKGSLWCRYKGVVFEESARFF